MRLLFVRLRVNPLIQIKFTCICFVCFDTHIFARVKCLTSRWTLASSEEHHIIILPYYIIILLFGTTAATTEEQRNSFWSNFGIFCVHIAAVQPTAASKKLSGHCCSVLSCFYLNCTCIYLYILYDCTPVEAITA